jgi:hypothetical protein
MYPHERSLVKQMEGRPFALLGVNSDRSAEELKQVIEKEKMTWRSWFAGPGGGAIAQLYQVQGWPSLFLIDHKGILREKWVGFPGAEKLDGTIEALVRDAEKASEVARQPAPKPPAGRTEITTKPEPEKPASDPDRLEKLAATKLKFARQLADDGKVEKAKERCQEIVSQYPNTKAAKEARQLLDKLARAGG